MKKSKIIIFQAGQIAELERDWRACNNELSAVERRNVRLREEMAGLHKHTSRLNKQNCAQIETIANLRKENAALKEASTVVDESSDLVYEDFSDFYQTEEESKNG